MFHRRMTALVLALPFLLPATAFGQSQQNDTPERPRQRSPMRGRQFTPEIDPAKDEVITTIKAAVSPSEEQMSQIIELYTKLRQDQRGAFREVFRYVFDVMKCKRVTFEIHPKNKRSRKLAEGLGARLEGKKRRGLDGRRNALVYGLLPEECRFNEKAKTA